MSTRQAIQLTAAILIFALTFSLVISAEETNKAPQPRLHEVTLPNGLETYLAEKLPNFRPATKADYDPVWFDPQGRSNALEGVWFNWSLRADFDGNGKDDYAILLTGTVENKPQVALVVARAVKKGWHHEVLESYASRPPLRLIIQLDPPGMKPFGNGDDVDAPLKMVRNPSIIRDVLETDATLRYYWKRGKWSEVFIGI